MATLLVWKRDDPTRNAVAGQLIDVVPDGKDWSSMPMMDVHPWLLLEVSDDTNIPSLREIDHAAGYRKPRVMRVIDLAGVDVSGKAARVDKVIVRELDRSVRWHGNE